MIFHSRLCAAIIAVYKSLRVLKLWWHGLTVDCSFEMPELHLHVDYASAAYRTAV